MTLPETMECPGFKEPIFIGKDDLYKLKPLVSKKDALILMYSSKEEKLFTFENQVLQKIP